MSLFPILGESAQGETESAQELPLLQEILCDEATGLPVWRGGAPVIVTGLEAVRMWAVTALRTARYRFPIYSDQFGSELDGLVGQNCSDEIKTAEAPRLVREALTASPYITGVTDVQTDFSGSGLAISATIKTIYGEAVIHG